MVWAQFSEQGVLPPFCGGCNPLFSREQEHCSEVSQEQGKVITYNINKKGLRIEAPFLIQCKMNILLIDKNSFPVNGPGQSSYQQNQGEREKQRCR